MRLPFRPSLRCERYHRTSERCSRRWVLDCLDLTLSSKLSYISSDLSLFYGRFYRADWTRPDRPEIAAPAPGQWPTDQCRTGPIGRCQSSDVPPTDKAAV